MKILGKGCFVETPAVLQRSYRDGQIGSGNETVFVDHESDLGRELEEV